jgi:hypothetical protein
MPLALLDLIAGVESPGYDVAYGGAKMPPGMTLEQTLAWAKAHGQKTGSSAVGRYQFIRPTLEGLVKETGLPLKTQFTPQVQDMLATKLLERRGLGDYASGKLSPERFAHNLSQEWAGLPSGPEGRSYYAGDKMGNRAGIGWDAILGTLARPDVRQAAAMGGMSTDTNQTPTGDPMTGAMDPRMMQQAPMPAFPAMGPVEAPAEAQPSMLELLALAAAGAYMGGGKGLSGALTGAGLAGNALREQLTADNELWDLKQKRADAMRRRQRVGALDEYAQTLARTPGYEQAGAMMQIDPSMGAQYLGSMQQAQREAALRQQQAAALQAAGRLQEAALVAGGISPGSVSLQGSTRPTYGTTPHYEREGDQTYVVRYASDGTKLREPVQGTPWAVERGTPGFAGDVAQAQAGGRTTGTAQAEAVISLPETLATIDRSLSVVDALLSHPGREWSVGWQGTVPPIAGTPQADYIMKLEQIGGANFLQAFEALKGGGQITEVEGAKATKAISDLDRRQTDAEHKKSLETLKEVFAAGRARALAKAGRSAPQEPVQGVPATPPLPPGFRIAP